ncbi:CUB and sushi domain-containing protein 1-like [Daphnia pulex]|uniref:CUB and sushi domain-containing protein 1-like n=1 Tax=Daphnia pulex TaxID=6669 RepID=UPI001EDF0A06|nr:CUB and sushi domain-containing protein 1-like [Daphnia pulex]
MKAVVIILTLNFCFLTILAGKLPKVLTEDDINNKQVFFDREAPSARACGGSYNTATGSFSSPNYPNPYGFNENCQYTIQVGFNDRVVLQFAYFNTESNFDYVTVYDGPTTASPVLLRLSGGPYSAYPDVVSSGSSCLVVHISDYSTSYNGWQANYYSTPITTTTTAAPVQNCPPYFQGDTTIPCWNLNGKCYCFSNRYQDFTWAQADGICRGGNMTLISLETKEEDEIIYNHFRATPDLNINYPYWTSGSYNNGWKWAATGQSFTYTNWQTGQPDGNPPAGYCAYVNFGVSNFNSGYWLDYTCTSMFRLICESF